MTTPKVLQRCNFCRRYFGEEGVEVVVAQEQPNQTVAKVYICSRCRDSVDAGVHSET